MIYHTMCDKTPCVGIVFKEIARRRYAYLVTRVGRRVQHRYLDPADSAAVATLVEEQRYSGALPEGIHALFWDADPRRTHLRRNRRYVIERILELGDLEAVRWMERAYAGREILQVLRTSRSLDERSLGFWLLWFGGDHVPEHHGREEDLPGEEAGSSARGSARRAGGRKRARPTSRAPYPFLDEVASFEGIHVAGILDIASMKMVAVCQRGSKRDFFDLYAVLGRIPFHAVASNAVRRYGKDRLNPVHVGKSLMYFADAESDPDPALTSRGTVEWGTVKRFFVDHVRQFVLDLDAAAREFPGGR